MIENDLLLLRKPVAEDFEAFAAMFAEPAVVAHIGGNLSRPDAWARFLRDVGHWSVKGFGQFIIVERQTDAFVGKVGFANFERDLGPKVGVSVEGTWTLRSNFHGRGYARMATEMAHDWYDRNVGGSLASIVAEANVPSLKLAQRLGYTEVDRLERSGGYVIVCQRERSDLRRSTD